MVIIDAKYCYVFSISLIDMEKKLPKNLPNYFIKENNYYIWKEGIAALLVDDFKKFKPMPEYINVLYNICVSIVRKIKLT